MSKPFEDKETHPSYGRIQISRITGGKRPLFGSSIVHGETMRIRITRASMERDLHTDHVFGGDELIEVEMSPVQFAELLTTHGTGVPCTLVTINRQAVEQCPYIDKKEQFRDEFKTKAAEIVECMNSTDKAIKEMRSAKSIKKSDVERLAEMLDSIRSRILSGMPFIAQCFDEQMDRSILEAKGEIEAHMLHRALRMAQEGMKFVEQLEDVSEGPIVQIGEGSD